MTLYPDPDHSLLSLPPPALGTEAMAGLAARCYGLSGTLTPLTSERDLNHRLTTATGRDFVLKLSNPAEPVEVTAFQTAALQHVATTAPALPVPRVLSDLKGRSVVPTPFGALRLLSWVSGMPLHATPRSPAQRRAIGTALASLTTALHSFDHPGADHFLLWDIKRAPSLLPLLPAIPDPTLRAEATTFLNRFTADVAPALATLPRQVVHCDFNPHNLLVDSADPTKITGILDFGDMVRTPRICDLAIAASYLLDHDAALTNLADLLHGYAQVLLLTDTEIALLFDLITARLFTTVTITSWRAARYPDNAAYIMRNHASAVAGLAAFRALDPAHATARFARASGKE
ncbi:phosphotransferase [Tabrizicola sp.]|uniref:phosphotransferase n=1 Tax=Tabrizicola sp. TaxID=2005166 RepID=UPI00286A11B7|nr:phosphotransferase [Tabrizicola sp.]